MAGDLSYEDALLAEAAKYRALARELAEALEAVVGARIKKSSNRCVGDAALTKARAAGLLP